MLSNYPTNFRKIIWPAAVVILSLLVAAFLFKDYLLHPNLYSFSFGGDALAMYYNMVYHTCFDHGATMQGMNYPYGEYVFLTDAQGGISSVLQWINHHLFYIGDSVAGIIHILNIYLLPVCSLMLYYILRYFDVRPVLAVVFAVLITFLSPPLLRFGGHFGLIYPFVIPMTMLWFLRKYKIGKMEVRDLAVLMLLIFFTLNNPYIGFGASAFLFCSGVLLILYSLKHREHFKKGILVSSLSLLAILIPFLLLHFNDPVDDRLQQQWGFFYFNATFRGLLFPPLSILFQILSALKIQVKEMDFESHLNLGIVTILLLTTIIVIGVTGLLRKKKWNEWITYSPENFILLGGAAMMFVFAANHSLLEVSKNWMENHLGPLLKFKASARLAWPIYFTASITGILFLDRALKKIKSPFIAMSIALILACTWFYEIKSYVGIKYKESYHPNFFKAESKNEILNTLKENHIDLSQYQAMLVLPKMMAWNDNFLCDVQWAAQFFSMRLSAATGLPMISAMLSRMSVSHCAEAIQMVANPVVRRDLVPKLPNQKDLLLLLGGENLPLSIGEQYLINISTPLYRSKDYSLFKLTLDTLQHSSYILEAQNLYRQLPTLSKDIIHFSFDSLNSSVSFYGPGARYIDQEQTIVVDQSLPAEKDTQYVFSAWCKVDYHQSGIVNWHLIIQDSSGQVITTVDTDTRRSNDIQDLWVRSETTFFAPKGSRIQATAITEKGIYIDEVLIYPVHASSIIDLPTSRQFLFNGYRVDKPE